MNTATERIMKTKEKIAKLKEQIRRKAATAGIILAASATMASCSPKQAQQSEENTDKQEQLSTQGEQKHDETTASFEDARWREAEWAQQVEKYKQMIADGADLDKRNSRQYGKSVLFEAVEWDNIKGAELLLKAGANPNLNMEGKQGETPVFYATSLEMVKLLEKYGADLNYKNKDGKQALYTYSGYGLVDKPAWNEQVVSYLIEKGNSLGNLDNYVASDAGRVKFCLEHGIKTDMQKALVSAANAADAEAVRLVLANGGRKYVNSTYTDDGIISTPLLDVVTNIVYSKANERAEDGFEKRYNDVVRLLIDNGADIHKKGNAGSPVELAQQLGEDKLIDFMQKCTVERAAKTQAMQAARARKAQRLVFFFYIPETAAAWQLPRFFRLFGLDGRD